jgi:hypothetical protein
MRLRTAIKIQRLIEEPHRNNFRCLHWKRPTIWKSRAICRRKWRDHRVPFIPEDDELEERVKMMYNILADAVIEDPEELEKFKEELWKA